MSLNDRDVILLRKKAEDLIQRAVDEGTSVDFQRVRVLIRLGEKYRNQEVLNAAIASLENGIAAANREEKRRSSRKQFIFKIKNLQLIKNLFGSS